MTDVLKMLMMFIFRVLLYPCIVVHEFGHYLAAIILRRKVTAIQIGAGDLIYEFHIVGKPIQIYDIPAGGGVVVNLSTNPTGRAGAIFMLASGLLFNLFVALLCFFATNHIVFSIYGFINFCFFAFSVWPFNDTDGHCIWQILNNRMPESMKDDVDQ